MHNTELRAQRDREFYTQKIKINKINEPDRNVSNPEREGDRERDIQRQKHTLRVREHFK